MSQETPPTPPPGFKLMLPNDGFMANNGPYYLRRIPDSGYEYGFQSDDRHKNPNNVLHGGATSRQPRLNARPRRSVSTRAFFPARHPGRGLKGA